MAHIPPNKKNTLHTRPRHFYNHFFDKLKFSERHDYLRDLRIFGTGLSRHDLAVHLSISKHSIRRYESSYYQAPYWYEFVLRLMSGDLSYFGDAWHECVIRWDNRRMTIPKGHKDFIPDEMISTYNEAAQFYQKEAIKLRSNIEFLEKEIKKAEAELTPHYDNVILFPNAFNSINQPRNGQNC